MSSYSLHPTSYRSFPVHPDRDVIRSGQPYSSAAVNTGSNNRKGVAAPTNHDDRSKGMRRLSYRERKRRNLPLSDSWTTDDRGEEGFNKLSALKKMKRVVNRVRRKGGYNPCGRQHRDHRSHKGSPGDNSRNSLTKRKYIK
jgi:hypothetical protein